MHWRAKWLKLGIAINLIITNLTNNSLICFRPLLLTTSSYKSPSALVPLISSSNYPMSWECLFWNMKRCRVSAMQLRKMSWSPSIGPTFSIPCPTCLSTTSAPNGSGNSFGIKNGRYYNETYSVSITIQRLLNIQKVWRALWTIYQTFMKTDPWKISTLLVGQFICQPTNPTCLTWVQLEWSSQRPIVKEKTILVPTQLSNVVYWKSVSFLFCLILMSVFQNYKLETVEVRRLAVFRLAHTQ